MLKLSRSAVNLTEFNAPDVNEYHLICEEHNDDDEEIENSYYDFQGLKNDLFRVINKK